MSPVRPALEKADIAREHNLCIWPKIWRGHRARENCWRWLSVAARYWHQAYVLYLHRGNVADMPCWRQ